MRQYAPLVLSTWLVCVGSILVAFSLTYPDEQASLPPPTRATPVASLSAHSFVHVVRGERATPFVPVDRGHPAYSNWQRDTLRAYTIADPMTGRYSGYGE